MRQTLIIVCIGVALVGGISLAVRLSEHPASPAPVAKAEAPAPTVRELPKAEAPSPAPEPTPRTPSKRPTAAPTPEAAPAPAPAAVDASPDLGTLHIDADVPGALVFIDREYLGVTPITTQNVKLGTHHLNVSAQGYEGISDTVDVAAGSRDILVKFKEVRLAAKIDVVHKHRFGSCKGQLIATPQGLRYETTDKNDAFRVGLPDLDGFEIDYLAKTLKVQLKKEQKYDFTDPDGNADRLFVFHRDVENARERIRKGDVPAAP